MECKNPASAGFFFSSLSHRTSALLEIGTKEGTQVEYIRVEKNGL
jgi:hypothetical protein